MKTERSVRISGNAHDHKTKNGEPSGRRFGSSEKLQTSGPDQVSVESQTLSSQYSVHKAVTCPEGQSAWALAHSLFGEVNTGKVSLIRTQWSMCGVARISTSGNA